MSIPYFPMFPDDFEADTAHLTLIEDGAYNRLLRLCWRSPGCSVPADHAWIMRKLRARSVDEQAAVAVVLDEFFDEAEGRYSNARLTREWHSAHEAHERRKNAGSAGGKTKSLKTNNSGPSNATAMLKQCSSNQNQNQNHKKEEDKSSSQKKRGARLPDDWTLPKKWGEWAIAEGWAESSVRTESAKFKDYWISKSGKDATKLDWFATWRNWMRNSRTPKITAINGGSNVKPSKQSERLNAFISGARGTS